ncbi:MAG: hypothetical protein K2P99_06015, partial [Burkholderiales bacterium]|nr:hypothetical protein [Burkholderiales bacterium]
MRRHQVIIISIILFLISLRFMIEFKSRWTGRIAVVPTQSSLEFKNITLSSNTSFIEDYNSPVISKAMEFIYYCDDPKVNHIWCQYSPPSRSLFRFPSPPDNLTRWNLAQNQAIDQVPVLLQRIMKVFVNAEEFLNGETPFREYHNIGDYFLDDNYDFDILDFDPSSHEAKNMSSIEKNTTFHQNIMKMLSKQPRKRYDW